MRKKIELKVIKVASLDQVIFKYSGLQDRFGRIYRGLYICSVMINWTVSSENCDKVIYKVLHYRTFLQNIVRVCPKYLISGIFNRVESSILSCFWLNHLGSDCKKKWLQNAFKFGLIIIFPDVHYKIYINWLLRQ